MTAAQTAATTATTWTIDPIHSFVEFSVKYMMVATAKGRFTTFAGTLQLDPAHPENGSAVATIDIGSIDTGNAQRDTHLCTDDFFNAEKFATATYRSTRVERADDDHARVYGDLTIRGVTKEIALDVECEGRGQDADGKRRVGFTATTAFDRLDYGIKWHLALETGGFVVSNRVKVTVNISAVRQD